MEETSAPPPLDPALAPVPAVRVTLDLERALWCFEWLVPSSDKSSGNLEVAARGRLKPLLSSEIFFQVQAVAFHFEPDGIGPVEFADANPKSLHALLRRVRSHATAVSELSVGVLSPTELGQVLPNQWHLVVRLPAAEGWKRLGRMIARYLDVLVEVGARQNRLDAAVQKEALREFATALVAPAPTPRPANTTSVRRRVQRPAPWNLRVEIDRVDSHAEFIWRETLGGEVVARGSITPQGVRRLAWSLVVRDIPEQPQQTNATPADIQRMLGSWFTQCPAALATLSLALRLPRAPDIDPQWQEEPLAHVDVPARLIGDHLFALAEEHTLRQSPLGRMTARLQAEENIDFNAHLDRLARKERKRIEEEARKRETMAQLAEQRRRRELQRQAEHGAAQAKADAQKKLQSKPAVRPHATLPSVPIAWRQTSLALQEDVIPLANLTAFVRRERAMVWWVSNQSDDLLCLPHCRIEHLDYQVRTALRALGPLRGRALLSDEVGLGKTIEAGLIAKELLTRGMAKRFLVLTLPSLVDQWAEELEEKFGLTVATTNDPAMRADPAAFWPAHAGIVASLHTLKQPAQLEVARQVHWDLLIIDEAHHLRNRASQAWQAVDALPRQFMLLLTATPVQNSLEELYNLVTLLQPGQLPSPKEFRSRFLDPERPRQPREPEELRRLLGQVMIRNTRANAGIDLPPRRAETIVFSPEPVEADFWRAWESEFRARLDGLGAGPAVLWGRLLLQAAGSSPAAWRTALEKFPDAAAARAWRERAPLEASWRRKCQALLPLTRGENGAVVFSQFLETQAALAEFLRGAGVPAFVINGTTPAAKRQPIVDEFRRAGGALLLTRSGTEGRNLQFCRTLANFDLPWNPMEIEQRIGRLHRLGQRHPVAIYNFVQAGTLQEHLLAVLQEKLNLFELVVGEAGLVLGDRFSSDEFEGEIFRRWQDNEGRVAEAIAGFGDELAEARGRYAEVKQLDETLFARDFESS